jgi:tRNA/rRNA methyltransferase
MLHIILLEPEHEGNVGAICRSMANFGFSSLIIINPKCDLENDEFYKRAKHSIGKIKIKVVKKMPKLDLIIGTTSKVSDDYNITRCPINAENLATRLEKLYKKNEIGLLFGREGIGLTNEEITKCDYIACINSSKEYSALNLSHAVAVFLYEIHKQIGKDSKKNKGKEDTNNKNQNIIDNIVLAGKIEMDQIDKMTNKIIDLHKFPFPKGDIQKKIWKNVFRKADLTKREAFGMMGLLNRILKNKK